MGTGSGGFDYEAHFALADNILRSCNDSSTVETIPALIAVLRMAVDEATPETAQEAFRAILIVFPELKTKAPH